MKEDIEILKGLGILIDADEEGYCITNFHKTFTRQANIIFEIIQRVGARGFGAGNFKALFESIEREQAKRGTLLKLLLCQNYKKGDKELEINAVDQNGNQITLINTKGRRLCYTYPKDMTPGCTAQSCNLSENYTLLQKNGYDVIGVSCDSGVKRHQKFIEKHSLPFNLISDEDQKVVNDYGVWQLKKFMGREYMGIVRTTF